MAFFKCAAAAAVVLSLCGAASADPPEVERLVGQRAQLTVALAGGAIVEFRLADDDVNPLNWTIAAGPENAEPAAPYWQGHFLCLDRWGPPSAAEAAHGMPYHGEASAVGWNITAPPHAEGAMHVLEMECKLPLANFSVRRRIALADSAAWVDVTEEVKNDGPLGRIYNCVQHPTIAPPFLDASTLVDAGAVFGIDQDGPIPKDRESDMIWPNAVLAGGKTDLRRFRPSGAAAATHDVTSWVFAESDTTGWVTAVNPSLELLIGYAWPTADYPWVSMWRHEEGGALVARGLEFGTTGLHQPFPELVKIPRLLGRPTFAFLDAGATAKRSYSIFLSRLPEDFAGVKELENGDDAISLVERRDRDGRTISIDKGRSGQPTTSRAR